jgi:hypothetical protein
MTTSPTMASVPAPRVRHQGPPLGLLAVIFTLLFCGGLLPVTTFGGRPYFPGPWESSGTIVAFFQARPEAVLWCGFFQFGAAIVLGIFTACIANQMRFLGVRAAGVNIALFGGFAAAFNIAASTFVLWTMAHPGIAHDATLTTALYDLGYIFGGPGFSVPQGLLMAGISIPAAFTRLLPKWIVVVGIALGICGELSWLNMVFPQALFLIPLTRFPGFVWMIAAGFALPNKVAVGKPGTAM